MNLTGGATFPTDMIKHADTKVNLKINFPCDTKGRMQ